MTEKVAIIGANGQIGKELANSLKGYETILFRREDLDITNYDSVKNKVAEAMPDLIINTAAFHRTDECEKNPERAYAVNTLAVKNLAEFCDENDMGFVHFSTDYVFDGTKKYPYTEEDTPNPLNIYGMSKLEGECYVRRVRKHLLIRTAYIFGEGGSSQKRTNLVETLLNAGRKGRMQAVYDHIFSPTYAVDLAKKVVELIEREKYGLYHLTNLGECSVYDFARKIYEIAGINPIIEKISLIEINSNPDKAKRPCYSVLNSINLKKEGISEMRQWEEALESYLKERGKDGF